MAQNSTRNCETLNVTDIFSLAMDLQGRFRFEVDEMMDCRAQICSAVWGSGNPDISGIGVGCPRPSRLRRADMETRLS